jgi:outer membrane receptor protein involved in Fe transport
VAGIIYPFRLKSQSSPKPTRSPSLSLADVLSFQHVKHNLRLGADFVRHQWDFRANVENYGEIDFPTFDQFLLGISDFSSIGVGLSDRNLRANDFDVFVQDDWKLSKKFTLNLGFRYELDMPAYDTKGRIGGFDPSLYKPRMEVDAQGVPIGPPIGGFVMAGNALPQYDLPGVPRVSNSVLKSINPNNFAPRVGFVSRPLKSDNLAVRAGYGIFYSPSSFFYVAWDFLSLPFYAGFNWSGQSFANPFPDAPRANQFPVLAPGVPLNISSMDRNNRTPYF